MTNSPASARTAFQQLAKTPLRLPTTHPPLLTTVISTEEEFDWTRPFDREATSVRAAAFLDRGQAVFDSVGVKPAYVVDYPIATGRESVAVLKRIHDSGRCEIGAHLHPWVSPPHEESVNGHHSFPGNLAPDLERRKIETLRDAIESSFGRRPRTYQAGRYGFGSATARILEEAGFDVDASASPPFDFSAEGGPDYSALPPQPFWFGSSRALLALPVTGAFVGYWQFAPAAVHRFAHHPSIRWARLPGVLARAGALERVRLSPEGFAFRELERLTRAVLARGIRIFVFSLHSPSLMPGCTPYVRDERELEALLETCRRYYQFFFEELGGRHLTPLELRALLLESCPPSR